MQKRRLMVGLLLGILLLFTAVFSTSADHLQTSFRAYLSGGQEVPAVTTDATGQAYFRLNEAGDELHFALKVRNIDGTFAAHVHAAPAGANGPVLVTLCGGPGVAPACVGPDDGGILVTGVITESLAGDPLSVVLDALRSGDTYVNVHSPAVPSGEVRGQIH